jgi:hypothetical protein
VRIGADYRELKGFEVAMAVTRLVMRGMDVDRGGSVADVAAAVDAALRDRKDATTARRLVGRWPVQESVRAQTILARLGAIQ